MPLGFYYSPPDMHHTAFRDTSRPRAETLNGEPTRPEWPLYLDYMQLQLTELLTKYGPAALIWFDGLRHSGEIRWRTISQSDPAIAAANTRERSNWRAGRLSNAGTGSSPPGDPHKGSSV